MNQVAGDGISPSSEESTYTPTISEVLDRNIRRISHNIIVDAVTLFVLHPEPVEQNEIGLLLDKSRPYASKVVSVLEEAGLIQAGATIDPSTERAVKVYTPTDQFGAILDSDEKLRADVDERIAEIETEQSIAQFAEEMGVPKVTAVRFLIDHYRSTTAN